jgi:hypothetical protein
MRYSGCNFNPRPTNLTENAIRKDEIMTGIPANQPPQVNPSQPPTPSSYPPPYLPYQPIIYPQPKTGPSPLKVVLIVVGIFVGLGLIGIGFLGYGVYKVAKSVNITTPSQPVTESDLGVAIYPGAEQNKQVVRMAIAGVNTITVTYLTRDAKSQVTAFYQTALGPAARSRSNGQSESLVLVKGAGESIGVTVSQSPSLFGGKTQIVIVHASKAATQAK